MSLAKIIFSIFTSQRCFLIDVIRDFCDTLDRAHSHFLARKTHER